jgi:hypothetical protein
MWHTIDPMLFKQIHLKPIITRQHDQTHQFYSPTHSPFCSPLPRSLLHVRARQVALLQGQHCRQLCKLTLYLITTAQTLEMEVQVLDDEVLSQLVEANDQMKREGKIPNQGVRMRLSDENDKQLFYGDVHPNI